VNTVPGFQSHQSFSISVVPLYRNRSDTMLLIIIRKECCKNARSPKKPVIYLFFVILQWPALKNSLQT
jgi:hypothetical protein